MNLTAGDKHILAQIVNRLHVSESDKEVIAIISEKLPKSTPAQLREACRYAVSVHHKNQDLFRFYRF